MPESAPDHCPPQPENTDTTGKRHPSATHPTSHPSPAPRQKPRASLNLRSADPSPHQNSSESLFEISRM